MFQSSSGSASKELSPILSSDSGAYSSKKQGKARMRRAKKTNYKLRQLKAKKAATSQTSLSANNHAVAFSKSLLKRSPSNLTSSNSENSSKLEDSRSSKQVIL
jgi:hypothetical protein